MDSYTVMLEKAEAAEACSGALTKLHKYTSFKAASKDPEAAEWAYWYVDNVIKGRWPKGEVAIAKDARCAYCYASGVIKVRWPKGEAAVAASARYACLYALYVIKGRWLEAEAVIAADSCYARCYAYGVIKGDWPEANVKLPVVMSVYTGRVEHGQL